MGDKVSIKFSGWFRKDYASFRSHINGVIERRGLPRIFDAFGDEISAIVSSALIISEYHSRSYLREIINRIMAKSDFRIPPSPDEFLTIIIKGMEDKKERFLKYVYVTGIMCNGVLPFERIKTRHSIITAKISTEQEKASLSKFVRAQNKLLDDGMFGSRQLEPAHEKYILKVFVKARNREDAFGAAQSELDSVLGLLNLSRNVVKANNITYHNVIPKRIYNDIYKLRFGTLHFPSGKLASEQLTYEKYWEEVSVKKRVFDCVESKDTQRFKTILSSLRRNHGLSLLAWKTLGGYNNALNIPDYQISFLKLWAVLEQLVGVDAGDSHNKIASRLAFLYSNPGFHRLEVNHLKTVRNSLTHEGGDLNTRFEEILLYQLNRYVSNLMYRIIKNGNGFSNHQEFIRFLDSPLDENQLRVNLKISEIALKFRSPKRDKS